MSVQPTLQMHVCMLALNSYKFRQRDQRIIRSLRLSQRAFFKNRGYIAGSEVSITERMNSGLVASVLVVSFNHNFKMRLSHFFL